MRGSGIEEGKPNARRKNLRLCPGRISDTKNLKYLYLFRPWVGLEKSQATGFRVGCTSLAVICQIRRLRDSLAAVPPV